MKFYRIISFLFLFFCGCMHLGAQVQVTVDGSQVSHQVSPMIQGHGLSYSMESDSIYADGSMVQTFKDVGTGFLRWPGGTVASKYHWNDIGAGWVDNWNPDYPESWDPEPHTYMDIDEYMAVTRAAGTEPMLGINMSSGMEWDREADGINEAVALVQYCQANNFNVKYYFLDNESYHDGNGYNEDKQGNGGEWTPALYAEKFNLYAAAIKEHAPDAIFFANWKEHLRNDVADYTTIINIAGDNIDYMDVHWYWRWGSATWANWKAKTPMENETDWYDGGTYVQETEFFNNLTASLGKPHIKLASLEWNIAPGDHNVNPSHTHFMTALMASEMQMQMMQAGIEVAAMWMSHWPNSATDPFQFLVDSDNGNAPNPMAKVFELYKHALNGQVIASSAANSNLMTVTVDKGGKVYVYLLNKADSDQVVEFNFSGVSIVSAAESQRFEDPGQLSDVYPWMESGKHRATAKANSLTMVAFNKDRNFDFELGLDSWGTWNNPVVTTDAYSGAKAIQMVDAGSINQTVVVEPNTTYTLSAYMKTSDGSKKVVFGVNDGNGVQLSVIDSYDTQYTQKQITFTTEANETSVNVWCWQPASGGASAFIDNITLVEVTGTDTTAPTPNRATFASAPAAGGTSSISMIATTGSDASGPVQYKFTETSGNPGATSSGWQTSPSYTDSGLSASTSYNYTVQMRDSLGNTGTASVAASATTTGVAEGQIDVSVNTSNTIASWVNQKYGINLNSGVDHDANRAAGARSLSSAFSEIGAKRLRFPGGEKSNYFAWTADPANPNPATQYWIGYPNNLAGVSLNFDEFMAICQENGAEAHVNVAAENNWNQQLRNNVDLVQLAAAWVKYANVTKGYGIKYWEIGNEMWHPDTKPAWTVNQLANIVIAYSDAMKAEDLSIKVGVSCRSNEAQTLINLCGTKLDFIAISNYTQYGGSYDAYMNANNMNLLKVDTSLTRQTVISEFNGALWAAEGDGDYWWDVGNHTGMGIINFDLVGQMLKSAKVDYGCMWNTRWYPDNGVYGETKWDAFDNQNNLLPVIQPFALWGQFIEPDLVQISAGDSAIVAYAAYDSGSKDLNVFLVNKSTWQSKNISLNITGSTYNRCEVTQFKGDHEWDTNSTISQLANATVSGNQVSYTLPNTSITVLALRTSAVPPTPGELINGDFENGLDAWVSWNSPQVTTDSYSGTNAIKMVDAGSINQTVVVEPNTTYTLSAYMKTSDGSKKVVLGVNDINEDHMAATDAYDTQYALQEVTFTTAAGQNSVIVYAWQPASGGASAFVDDVSLLKVTGGDTDPPTPNAATFVSAPSADSGTAISMIATTGSDPSGPVQYKFTETTGNPGATSSGWQTSPSYTDSGLSASTTYSYTVQMRDSLGNTGTASVAASATTQTPPVADPPYATWASDNSVTGGFGDDDDGDGIANGHEWYFHDSDPKTATGSHGSQLTSLTETAPGTYAFSHVRPKDRTDVIETYQWSRDLSNWYAGGESNGAGLIVNFAELATTPVGPGPEHETVTMSAPVAGPLPPQLFYRLRLSGTSEDPTYATSQQLESFYAENGGRDAFPEHQVNALEALLYAQDELEAGEFGAARARVDAIFAEMPLSDPIWQSGIGYGDLNIGNPVAYYGLRVLDQILDLNDPQGAGSLQMTVVVAPCAQVARPTLPSLAPETVQLDIAPEILADGGRILHESTKLFRHWVQAITGGLQVNLVVHVMDECTTVNYTDDGSIIRSYPDAGQMIDSVPSNIANTTDFWWVIAPSGVPGDGSGYDRHFITGGMGSYGAELPLFLSDDAWFTRKVEHLGSGPYSEIELRAYQPQWFQHEFMHHVYRVWPEFGLESTDHQWFDRSTWPADFVGSWEPDYYAESFTKRIFGASVSVAEGLQAPDFADMSVLPLANLLGDYQHDPVENPWHEINISLEEGNLRWNNNAGVSWGLEILGTELWSEAGSPYGANKLYVQIDENENVLAVYFNGVRYGRTPASALASAPAQTLEAARSFLAPPTMSAVTYPTTDCSAGCTLHKTHKE